MSNYKYDTNSMEANAGHLTECHCALNYEMIPTLSWKLHRYTDVGQHQKICVVLLRKDMISDK